MSRYRLHPVACAVRSLAALDALPSPRTSIKLGWWTQHDATRIPHTLPDSDGSTDSTADGLATALSHTTALYREGPVSSDWGGRLVADERSAFTGRLIPSSVSDVRVCPARRMNHAAAASTVLMIIVWLVSSPDARLLCPGVARWC